VIEAQRELAARLADRLPATWRDAYEANPRHLFLPDRVWRMVEEPLDRATDPDGWLAYAYSDDSVITQLHDGAAHSGHGYPISSSCSMPAIVFAMLSYLDVSPGHRVLEIGTGTGWSTSLLSHRLGDDQVISIEVDPSIAGSARRNLARVGRSPRVVTGNGADGYARAAPYDRVIATCSVQAVPHTWVRQTQPGGIILTPWGTTFDNSALLRLTVDENGDQAVGRIVDWAIFMFLRAQRPRIPDEPDDFDVISERSRTDVDLADLLGEDARFGIGLNVPDCRLTWELGEDGYLETLWLLAPDAWASVRNLEVRQAGVRRLWDEATAGYSRWLQSGRPCRDQYGVSVTPDRQYVWLDHPANPISPLRLA
jgi:protein-L-isoaspartate(D-aspartate) O-methyltransferase